MNRLIIRRLRNVYSPLLESPISLIHVTNGAVFITSTDQECFPLNIGAYKGDNTIAIRPPFANFSENGKFSFGVFNFPYTNGVNWILAVVDGKRTHAIESPKFKYLEISQDGKTISAKKRKDGKIFSFSFNKAEGLRFLG